MTPSIAYVEYQKNWYLLFGWNFGAKQEEIYSDEYQEKKAATKGSAKRYTVARDLVSFRKKIKEGKNGN